MDAQELRAIQTPLKERYRADPAAALVTLHARGRLGEENVACRVETGKALVEAGLHPATGGDGRAACSGDLLLEALVACAGVTLKAVATALALPPVGFQAIRLRFDLDSDATAEQIDTLLRLTERFCVVYQTLKQPANITLSVVGR